MSTFLRTGFIHITFSLFALVMPIYAQQTPVPGQNASSSQPPAQSAPGTSAEAKPKTTYETATVLKVTTRLVVVDVVALDRKGAPVTDLKPEELSLFEDGKEQKIRTFSFQQPAANGPETAAVSATPARLSPGIVTNVPRYSTSGSLNIILLDGLNTRLTNQAYAREEMIKFLEKIPQGQPVAVYLMGTKLRLLQDFTTDPSQLKAAIKAWQSNSSQLLDASGTEAPFVGQAAFEALPAQVIQNIVRFQQDNQSFQTDLRVSLSLQILNSLARMLSGYPGRKNLIWVSESFPLQILPETTPGGGTSTDPRSSSANQDYTVEVARTASLLTDAQIAIYPVDPRGLVGNSVYSDLSNTSSTGESLGRTLSGGGFRGRAGATSELDRTSDELLNSHATMEDLASRTGGKAYYNRNDLNDAFLKSMQDGSTYYTLAYSPDNKEWNSKFRKINLKTTRSGVKLRYRLGYFAIDPQNYGKLDDKRRASDLGNALDVNFPVSTALLFRAQVQPPSEKTKNHVLINYAIDPHAISFEHQDDGLEHASVDCATEVYTPKGQTIKTDINGITAALKPDIYQKVLQSWLPCSQTFDLPPGDYMLRIGVRDNRTGLTGTTNATLKIPVVAAASSEPATKKPE
jgi:VWFA-related protein